MQVCACVMPYRETRIMLHHGNDFAATGFGYAIELGAANLSKHHDNT